MRKVLIVSPHFAPVNTADMHRVRLCLPWLREHGWEPTVLAVVPESIEGAVVEPLLEKTYPGDIRIIRVKGISPRLTRPFGIGSLWLRCGRALRKAGDTLLRNESFDLVFFSTTVFNSFSLGPRWLHKFAVPYILDYHDPWRSDYYQRTNTRPPGGKLKYAITQWQAKQREPRAVCDAAAIISVSSAYGPELCRCYPHLDPRKIHHLPFGASPKDIEVARTHRPQRPLIPDNDGLIHLVYTGRVVAGMAYALQLLFRAFTLYQQTHPEDAQRIHFHFIGTDYAPPPLGRHWVMPLAEKEGIRNQVSEHPYRVPYFDALYYMSTADALLILGSDEPGYSASKISPYLFATRPLLTIAHRDSLMLQTTREQGHTSSYDFSKSDSKEAEQTIIRSIHGQWFSEKRYCQPPVAKPAKLKAHSALEMTKQLSTIFYASINSGAMS